MLARLRLFLLCALVLASLSVRASADARHAASPSAAPAAAGPTADAAAPRQAAPAIEADLGAIDEGVRAAERAELLTTRAPVLAPGDALPRSAAGIPAPAACRAAGWSDVVQCRRWSGAHLLRWATPPPARA